MRRLLNPLPFFFCVWCNSVNWSRVSLIFFSFFFLSFLYSRPGVVPRVAPVFPPFHSHLVILCFFTFLFFVISHSPLFPYILQYRIYVYNIYVYTKRKAVLLPLLSMWWWSVIFGSIFYHCLSSLSSSPSRSIVVRLRTYTFRPLRNSTFCSTVSKRRPGVTFTFYYLLFFQFSCPNKFIPFASLSRAGDQRRSGVASAARSFVHRAWLVVRRKVLYVLS